MQPEVLDLALDALESLEIRSLTWGFVDHTLGEAEAEAAIAAALQSKSFTDSAAEVLKGLCNAALVRPLQVGEERRYRTRVAELTRLLSRLRQWFPGNPWQSAPTLVSDFRISVRPRRYPRWNISPQEAWARLNAARQLSSLQTRVWEALTGHDPSFALSEFQVEAAGRLLGSDPGTGTMVTAGTGSGKTLAFYLPALIAIAPEVRAGESWTKVICLYPRQELLKDQLSEAYRLTLRAAPALRQERRRPFVLGSLFGPTPFDASEKAVIGAGWVARPNGYVCPYLRCPNCTEDMVWSKERIGRKQEVLECVKEGCKTQTDGTTLRLTRQALAKHPPDLLFTTTEMMNQRLSDTWTRGVFGVGKSRARRPLLVLLDEVHTYGGVPGAQVALLLRRWSALLGSRVRWAGLSATLPRPEKFFADLTGLRADRVACIEPKPEDMILEDAEYNIILRSDPSSQAATLSTSIQAIMLLSRMLDTRAGKQSGRRFGSRTFVFTDDLDVTHRLFDDLLSAEAYTRRRYPDPAKQPLAALRGSGQPDALERELHGQCWEMAEELRSDLATRLRVGRTTSRDPGVDAAADVIIATSSLEVGFNDPDVGAVVQHKAPRSAASFLQRRGRAGRSRGMRPLTLIILSDYGRDRVAFQSYEHLFDPTVEIQALPVRNLYVLRMQAVYATLEWITDQAPEKATGWAWRVTTGPGEQQSELREHFKEVLQSVLKFDDAMLTRLRKHLMQALGVDAETLDIVLWQPPRSLLLDALPTLGRRLFRQWKLASGTGLDLHEANPPHPLPDFIPANLFSDLNLPEVQIEVPLPGAAVQLEYMPIVQALQQFVPGRVRRRFADHEGKISHWFPLDLAMPEQRLKISDYARRHEYVGNKGDMPIFRPWQVAVATVPYNVNESSNALWRWQSDFDALGEPTLVPLPSVAGLNLVAHRLEFRLHRFGAGVTVRRFAHEGEATAGIRRQEFRVTFKLVDERDEPAAIGFAFEADALLVAFRLPSQAALADLVLPPGLTRWLRYEAFARHVEVEPGLSPGLNHFRREWLHQATLLTALMYAEGAELPLRQALQALRDDDDPGAFTAAIDALVNATLTEWSDDDVEVGDAEDDNGSSAGNHAVQRPQRLRDALMQAVAEPGVMNALIDVALRWISPSTDDWGQWLSEVACTTFGEAVYQACVTAVPQNTATEGLTVDVEVTAEGHRAIIAETTLGGGGTVEALAEVFAADPRAFVRSLESACAPSDQEMAAEELRRVLGCLANDKNLAAVLARLRAAADTDTRDLARREFFTLLAAHGIPVSRTLSVAIATRLIRPGMSPDSDALCGDLLHAWQSLEEKYGIALPLRLATAMLAQSPELQRRLAKLGGAGQEILTAGMMLWPLGGELRRSALQSYNPFRRVSIVDAALMRQLLFDARLPSVNIDASDWLLQLRNHLAAQGVVRLTTGQGDQTWRGAVARLLSEPIVSGYLQFYPTIEATRVLEDGQLAIDLVLRDRV